MTWGKWVFPPPTTPCTYSQIIAFMFFRRKLSLQTGLYLDYFWKCRLNGTIKNGVTLGWQRSHRKSEMKISMIGEKIN